MIVALLLLMAMQEPVQPTYTLEPDETPKHWQPHCAEGMELWVIEPNACPSFSVYADGHYIPEYRDHFVIPMHNDPPKPTNYECREPGSKPHVKQEFSCPV